MKEKIDQLIIQKDFPQAMQLIEKSFHDTPALKYFNLGYLAFEQSDYVNARYYLEKAQIEGLFSSELSNALVAVKSHLGLETIDKSYYAEDEFFLNSVGFHSDVYLGLFGIFLLLALFFYYRAKVFLGTSALVLTLLIGSFYYYAKDLKLNIIQEQAIVLAGPSKIFNEQQKLIPGMKVISEPNSKSDWTYIKYPKAYRGWVFRPKVKSL